MTPLASEATPCIQVLAFDRPQALLRLLNRLNQLDYGADVGRVWLRINLDAPAESAHEATIVAANESTAIAEAFTFNGGVKTVRTRTRSVGLMRQWLEAWVPDSDVHDAHAACVLLEDDLLPSVHAWTWTRRALAAYGAEPHVFSLGLQRPTLVPAMASVRASGKLGRMPPKWRDDGAPFLYRLLSSWGFVAIRRSWRCFLRWMDSPARLVAPAVRFGGALLKTERWALRKPAGAIWTHHCIRYMDQRNLYTLYPSIQERVALCSNLREAGLNFASGLGADFPPLANGSAVELTRFPPFARLHRYGWDALPVPPRERAAARAAFHEDGCPAAAWAPPPSSVSTAAAQHRAKWASLTPVLVLGLLLAHLVPAVRSCSRRRRHAARLMRGACQDSVA